MAEIIFKLNKINMIIILLALVIPIVNASQISFNEYEINKIGDLVVKDCKSSTFLYICSNSETIEKLGMKGDCIDYGFNLEDQNEVISFGELQKYYNGELININSYEGKEGVLYSVHIENIKKEQIIRYLSLINNKILVNYEKNFPFIGCYISNSTVKIKELSVDETNQKFWDGKLIKEPRTYIYIGELKINIFDFGLGISFTLVSIALISLIVKIVKKLKS